VDEQRLGAELGLCTARAHAAEARDEAAVGLCQRVEVPGLRDDPGRLTERAELGAEADDLRRRPVPRDVGQLLLALRVRRDPQTAAERAEPRPREAGAHLVAHLAALLGHAQDDKQPAPVPVPRLAEGVDALGA
jgi:hypothetical protein